jgi:hypothetical protein
VLARSTGLPQRPERCRKLLQLVRHVLCRDLLDFSEC